MTIKKISSNYTQTVDALGLPKDFYAPIEQAAYQLYVEQDIKQTCLYSPAGKVDEHREILRDATGHGDLSYIRGNFDGGLFSELTSKNSSLFNQNPHHYKNINQNLKNTLRFSYIDDDIPCAFAMTYVKGVDENKGKYFYNIAVIRDVTASPDKRQVTFFSHEALMPDDAFFQSRHPEAITNVASKNVAAEVITALNSASFVPHVTRLCESTKDSYEYHENMKSCFSPGKNANFEKLNELQQQPTSIINQMMAFAVGQPLLTAGVVGLIVAATVVVTAMTSGVVGIASLAVKAASALGLFAASATYHNLSKANAEEKTSIKRRFKYTNQATEVVDIDPSFSTLITQAKSKLDDLKAQSNSPDEKEKIQTQLDKINSLQPIEIPLEYGKIKRYYSIADNAGGVTEKTCLVSEESVVNSLVALANSTTIADVDKHKIRMNAILKHPKDGKDTEVQREAIGLEIARILGFKQVTESKMVLHDTGSGQHPCLFVPFGDMELLTDHIQDAQTMRGRLNPNQFQHVEDLGKYSAFFMLCSDPDFIGKNGQNKGLTNANNDEQKRLYIFDQVFMNDNNLGLDRAFNLIPTNPLTSMPSVISRHFMGRNKSVINDSSYEEKIKGALHLLSKKEDITRMFNQVALVNQSNPYAPAVKALEYDAKQTLKTFNARIKSIEKLFPPLSVEGIPKKVSELDEDESKLLTKAMLLTQLLNKPKLFDASGKPYRAPFFTTPSTYVNRLSIHENSVEVSFNRRFGAPLSELKKETLRSQGFRISKDGKSAIISKDKLLELNEHAYFKENQDAIDIKHNYINPKHLDAIANTYLQDSMDILKFVRPINKTETGSREKIAILSKSLDVLHQIHLKNPGFVEHVKQCLLYEAVKEIMRSNPESIETIQREFVEAKRTGQLETYVKDKCVDTIKRFDSAASIHAFKDRVNKCREEIISESAPALEDSHDSGISLLNE
jgi:hypothetical protein